MQSQGTAILEVVVVIHKCVCNTEALRVSLAVWTFGLRFYLSPCCFKPFTGMNQAYTGCSVCLPQRPWVVCTRQRLLWWCCQMRTRYTSVHDFCKVTKKLTWKPVLYDKPTLLSIFLLSTPLSPIL